MKNTSHAAQTYTRYAIAPLIGDPAIQTAMATIIFSVSDTEPGGTSLSPPTHAHFTSRLST